jgi:uncharacterized protein YcaQ
VAEQGKIVLTAEQATAFTMTRQFLAKPAQNPLDTVRRLVAIQAQYATSVPLTLWARTDSFPAGWVDEALLATRELVKTWSLRGTVHVLASADLAMIVAAVGLQQVREHERFMKTRRALDGPAIGALNAAIVDALAQGPLGRAELHQAVPALAEIAGASWGLDVKGLALLGQLVFADKGGADSRFARRDRWLPALAWAPPAEVRGRRELLLRYLEAYGPATMQDFSHWSGLQMKAVRETLAACGSDLAQARVVPWPGDYILRVQDVPAFTDCGEPRPVTLLPKFDPLLMAYQDKRRFIDQADLSRVYRPGGQVEAVVLSGAHAAATWRTRRQGTKLYLTIRPFRLLSNHEESRIALAAEQLAEFAGARDLILAFDRENAGM